MPWKECNRMDERLRFVARLLDGWKMAVVCREFGISRKTGYKIFNRYKDYGLRRSRRNHKSLSSTSRHYTLVVTGSRSWQSRFL